MTDMLIAAALLAIPVSVAVLRTKIEDEEEE